MEFSDFFKILFGAIVGFGVTWLQSLLKRDEDRLKIHREKIEQLYLDVSEWIKSAATFVGPGKDEGRPDIVDEINKDAFDRIEMLIRFYASNLWDQYRACMKIYGQLITSVDHRDTKGVLSNLHDFRNRSKNLSDAIVAESKKYIPQSAPERFKNLLSRKRTV